MVSAVGGVFNFSCPKTEVSPDQALQELLGITQTPVEKWNQSKVGKLIQRLQVDQFHHLIEEYARQSSFTDSKGPNLAAIELLVHSLSKEQLDTLDVEEFVDRAKLLLREAEYQLNLEIKKTPIHNWQARVNAIYRGFLALIDTLISSFGLSDLFKTSEDDRDAQHKMWRIQSLLYTLSGLGLFLAAVLPPSVPVFLVLGAIVIALAGLEVLYKKFLQPVPSELPQGPNWTTDARLGKLATIEGRQSTIQEIAETLIANHRSSGVKHHPLLVGKTGVGKTATVKALTQAITDGVFPELKGKTVYYINTAKLLDPSGMSYYGAGQTLQQISELMGRHRENIILVFDEIHIACAEGDNSILGEQLKTLLDVGEKNFPYVIGMTTLDEYNTLIAKNKAFNRRFKKIRFESMSQSETLNIVRRQVRTEMPDVVVEPNALSQGVEKIFKEFPEEPQPYFALEMLASCVKDVRESQGSEVDRQIEKVNGELDNLSAEVTHSLERRGEFTKTIRNEKLAKLRELKEELAKLNLQKGEERKQREKLKKLFAMRTAVKRRFFRSTQKVAAFCPDKLSRKELSELFLFHTLQDHLLPAILEHALALAKEVDLPMEINEAQFDKVIADERARRLASAPPVNAQVNAQVNA